MTKENIQRGGLVSELWTGFQFLSKCRLADSISVSVSRVSVRQSCCVLNHVITRIEAWSFCKYRFLLATHKGRAGIIDQLWILRVCNALDQLILILLLIVMRIGIASYSHSIPCLKMLVLIFLVWLRLPWTASASGWSVFLVLLHLSVDHAG